MRNCTLESRHLLLLVGDFLRFQDDFLRCLPYHANKFLLNFLFVDKNSFKNHSLLLHTSINLSFLYFFSKLRGVTTSGQVENSREGKKKKRVRKKKVSEETRLRQRANRKLKGSTKAFRASHVVVAAEESSQLPPPLDTEDLRARLDATKGFRLSAHRPHSPRPTSSSTGSEQLSGVSIRCSGRTSEAEDQHPYCFSLSARGGSTGSRESYRPTGKISRHRASSSSLVRGGSAGLREPYRLTAKHISPLLRLGKAPSRVNKIKRKDKGNKRKEKLIGPLIVSSECGEADLVTEQDLFQVLGDGDLDTAPDLSPEQEEALLREPFRHRRF